MKQRSKPPLGITISLGTGSHHRQSNEASERRVREAHERRLRDEEARIAREEEAKIKHERELRLKREHDEREQARLLEEALAHQRALNAYPNLKNDALTTLRPLTSTQSNVPPQNEENKTLPYLLLTHRDIDGFLCLINEKNYKLHLPQLEYNPLRWLSHNSEAVLILKQIRNACLTPELYLFLAIEALAQFDEPNSPCDSILIWLLDNEKLPNEVISTLNKKIISAMTNHYELSRHFFLQNGQFTKQNWTVRTLFLTQLLSRKDENLIQLHATLTQLYAQHHQIKHAPKIVDIGLLFTDLMDLSEQSVTSSLALVGAVCKSSGSPNVSVSKQSWQELLAGYDPKTIRQFVELTQKKMDSSTINTLASMTFDLVKDQSACATILECWLPQIANTTELQPLLIKTALDVCSTYFEFSSQLLSLSTNIIKPQEARISLLTQLLTLKEGGQVLKSWYYKNKQYHIEALWLDLEAIQQKNYALQFIQSIIGEQRDFLAYSKGFLEHLMDSEELTSLTDVIAILYHTFSVENKTDLQRLIMQGLKDNTEKSMSLFDWHLYSKRPLFGNELFLQENELIRLRIITRLFDIHHNDLEQIKYYLRLWYQGNLFYITEMNSDLQSAGHQDLMPLMLKELTANRSCIMMIGPELFALIHSLGEDTPIIIANLAGLVDKRAISSFLASSHDVEYKISLLYRHPEAFVANDFYDLFRNFIIKEQLFDQYRYIEDYALQQQRLLSDENTIQTIEPSAPPKAMMNLQHNLQTTTPPESGYFAQAVLVSSSMTSQSSTCGGYAVAVPVEEHLAPLPDRIQEERMDASLKADLPANEKNINHPPKEPEIRSPITQKILLAFIKVSFEKISHIELIINTAKQFQHEWLQFHFIPSYIEIMYQWGKMSVLLLSIGHDENPSYYKINEFMNEPGIPPPRSWSTTFTKPLYNLGIFATPEAELYKTICASKMANKAIGHNPELVNKHLTIENELSNIFKSR